MIYPAYFLFLLSVTIGQIGVARGEAYDDTVQYQYIPQWAIEGHDDGKACEELVDGHDLHCLGPVGSFDKTFVVQPKTGDKRSYQEITESLLNNNQLRLAVQQRALQRYTRLLTYPTIRENGTTSTSLHFNDPLYPKQWYITGGSVTGSTLNVEKVWRIGYNGNGVVVTVIDSSVNIRHPDLIANADTRASLDVIENDDDPAPIDLDSHGTSCAGEIAATANNHKCGVGIAHKARVGGIRAIFSNTTDVMETIALSYNKNHIDIYSCSWGPSDDGVNLEGPQELTRKAFVEGAAKGRNGLGNIFVFASGNGGVTDSCACDGYVSSIYTISVGAVDYRHLVPPYVEPCASKMVATFSSGSNHSILGLSSDGNCTGIGATSAAAPQASAIIALTLQANPNITWRDVQYLTVLTANDEYCPGNWSKNAIGRPYDTLCGYGVMDAYAMVRLAELWTTVPPQHVCSTPMFNRTFDLPEGTWVHNISFDACIGTPQSVRFIEHVELVLSLAAPRRGNVNIVLVSPGGTRSTLLTTRPRDNQTAFVNWPFMSVQFWGEAASGIWSVEVFHFNASFSGNVTAMKLIVYGTDESPVRLSDHSRAALLRSTKHSLITDFEAPLSSSAIVSPRVDRVLEMYSVEYERYDGACHAQCAGLCYGPSALDCAACANFVAAVDNSSMYVCVEQCPSCTRPKVAENGLLFCVSCGPNCTKHSDCFEYQSNMNLVAVIGIIALLMILAVGFIVCLLRILRRRKRSWKRVRTKEIRSSLLQDDDENVEFDRTATI